MAQYSRQVISSPLTVEGRPVKIRLIENPLIDDVLMTEAKVQAAVIGGQIPSDPTRRVSRDLRNFFIKLGVDS